VYLNGAQTTVVGGGDTIHFASGSGNAASLYSTANNWDAVNGSNGSVYLTNAQAGIAGGSDVIHLSGTNGLTQAGASNTFVFQAAIGLDTINGFAASDSFQFSKADFANFAALQAHIKQSGSNALISLDASDTITLTGVAATSLTSAQFHFV
jgi:hypothetical protein